MKSVTSTEATTRLDELLAEVAATGESVTITSLGKPVAIMSPASPARRFGQFACRITIPNDLDAPLDEADLSECEGGA